MLFVVVYLFFHLLTGAASSSLTVLSKEDSLNVLSSLKALRLLAPLEDTYADTRALCAYLQEPSSEIKRQAALNAFPVSTLDANGHLGEFWKALQHDRAILGRISLPKFLSPIKGLSLDESNDARQAEMIYTALQEEVPCFLAFAHDQKEVMLETFVTPFSQRFSFPYHLLQETKVPGKMSFYVREDCFKRFRAMRDGLLRDLGWEQQLATRLSGEENQFTPYMKTVLARREVIWEIVAALRHPPMLAFLRKALGLHQNNITHNVGTVGAYSFTRIDPTKILDSILQNEDWESEEPALGSQSNLVLLLEEIERPDEPLNSLYSVLMHLERAPRIKTFPVNNVSDAPDRTHLLYRTTFGTQEINGERVREKLIQSTINNDAKNLSLVYTYVSCRDQNYPAQVTLHSRPYKLLRVHEFAGGALKLGIYLHAQWVQNNIISDPTSHFDQGTFWNDQSTFSRPLIIDATVLNRTEQVIGDEFKESTALGGQFFAQRRQWHTLHESVELKDAREAKYREAELADEAKREAAEEAREAELEAKRAAEEAEREHKEQEERKRAEPNRTTSPIKIQQDNSQFIPIQSLQRKALQRPSRSHSLPKKEQRDGKGLLFWLLVIGLPALLLLVMLIGFCYFFLMNRKQKGRAKGDINSPADQEAK